MTQHESWNKYATDLQKKWMEELLSGKHKQCKWTLFDGSGYCCLGVARKFVLENAVKADEDDVLEESERRLLNLFSFVGIQQDRFDGTHFALSEYNDGGYTDGRSFKEIAEMIMATPWVWFSNFPVPEGLEESV